MTAERWRVAQITAEHGPARKGARGSGYLVAPGRVLTAAHVVAGAPTVRVRLDVGRDTQIEVQAESWWADPAGADGTDLAVIRIPETATTARVFEPALFGRIRDCTAVLAVAAFGFPLFKLRPRGVFRDFEQVTAHAPVAANSRQGTLAVHLDDPPPRQSEAGQPSPWEGMSGAAVWAAGRIVAVVTEHHPSEGTGRLAACRVDRAYAQLPALDLGVLTDLLRLPQTVGALADVVAADRVRVGASAYLAQVRDITPDELVGREGELAKWAEFCAGTDPYTWWQAGPWAGKSALASWFVMHPPAGVDVVSFFITGRLYGQSDSNGFLDAMIEQLRALLPAGAEPAATTGARAGTWLNLLEAAAAHAGERGRRLVVVVDGLDEDDAGAAPCRGRQSIASLLPRRPPPGVRFIITSRPNPGLPDDLPVGHPLRVHIPHQLPASKAAEGIGMRARQELGELLAGEQISVDLVGYVAGSGGGLTGGDLSELTGAPPYKLDPLLRGVSGRSLQTRASADPRDPSARVYLFAHETLRVSSEAQLGRELDRYRQQVHEWMDSCASAGWPATAPSYAIRGYPGLLAATADAARLTALARDPRRHAFLLDATGSDFAALTEIRTAQAVIAEQSVTDIQALVVLAAHRHALSVLNQCMPAELPGVWAQLGRLDHAEAVALSIPSPDDQTRALSDLAEIAAADGDPGRAQRLAAEAEAATRCISSYGDQTRALLRLITAASERGDPDHAESLARTVAVPAGRAIALTRLAAAAIQHGDPSRAQRLAAEAEHLAGAFHFIGSDQIQAEALAVLAISVEQGGDPQRGQRLAAEAEALARTITDPLFRGEALALLATAAAQGSDFGRAKRLAAEAETLARSVTENPYLQGELLARLAADAAQCGDLDRAKALARTIFYPDDQSGALIRLVTATAQAGDSGGAQRLAAEAEALARTISDTSDQVKTFTSLVTAAARAGDSDRAYRLASEVEALARTIVDSDGRSKALTGLAKAAAQVGDIDRAEALARQIASPDDQAKLLVVLSIIAAQVGHPVHAEALARTINDAYFRNKALIGLVTAAAQVGDIDHAKVLAGTITDPDDQTEALTRLFTAAAQGGPPGRTRQLAAEAETAARTITEPYPRAQALIGLVTAAVQVGDSNRAYRLAEEAETVARLIANPYIRAREFIGLAIAAVQVGDSDHAYRLAEEAETMAGTFTDSYTRDQLLIGLVAAAAQAGDLDRAEALAGMITSLRGQAEALTGLVTAVAQAGDLDRAEALAGTITFPGGRAEALTGLVTAVAQAGDLDRAQRLTAEAQAMAFIITDPDSQGKALTGLVIAIAQAGAPDTARHLLARALILDLPGPWWTEPVSRLFPSAIEGAWSVMLGAYDAV